MRFRKPKSLEQHTRKTRRTTLLALLLATVAAVAGLAQDGPRSGSPRMMAIEAFQTLLAADEAETKALLTEKVAPSLLASLGEKGVSNLFADIRKNLQGASMRGAEPFGPVTALLVYENSGTQAKVRVSVEKEKPHRLTEVILDVPMKAVAKTGSAGSKIKPSAVVDGGGFPTVEALGAEVVRLLNLNDFDALALTTAQRFRDKYGSDTQQLFRELRSGLPGTLRFEGIREDGGQRLVHLDADGAKMRFMIVPTPEAPFTITSLDTLAVPAFPEETLAKSDWPKAIGKFLDQQVRNDTFSGAVLVAEGADTLFAKTFGVADASTGRKLTLDTPVNIGSMNKMFTGLAIGQLEARGLLDYNDLVGKYLPEYPIERVRDEVTIHHLLTHTSGIPSYWNEAYSSRKREIDSLDELVTTFQNEPLDFAPGKDWQYSNGGPVLLGMIIERLTGMSYYDYIRKHIYQPAGMTNTDHYQITDKNAGFAIGYMSLEKGEPHGPNTENMGLMGSPAGGGYASANDLKRFAIALAQEKLLSRKNLERIWSPPKNGSEESRYGYLWGSSGEGRNRWVGHNGGAPGISADFRYYPESGYVVVVLSTVSRGAMPISEWLAHMIKQER